MALGVAPPPRLRFLLIEGNPGEAELLRQRFADAGYDVDWVRVATQTDLASALNCAAWDLVISDHSLAEFDALGALGKVRGSCGDVPFIILSKQIDEDVAVRAMRAGANDCLSKYHLERLVPACERELREARNRRERSLALAAERESEARLQALAANTPGVIFSFQLRESGDLAFQFAGGATQLLLGLSPEELIADGNRYVKLIVEEDLPGFLSSLAASPADGKLNWEGRILSSAGDIKWINLRSSVRRQGNGDPVWEGLMWNITQSKHTEAELRDSQRQLAALSRHLQHAKEEERERIAREVHDVLGGDLVALKIEASLLAGKMLSDPILARQRVSAIEALLDDAIETVSRVTRELRPGILKDFGLAAAIECQAEDFSQRSGTRCQVLAADHDIELAEDTGVALFRIFQEALTNVRKHAQASTVAVRLLQEGDEVLLEIADDGNGLAQEDLTKPKSFGLRGIRERLAGLGGSLEIDTSYPRGTRLIVRVPAAVELEQQS
ncbi:MAG: response regulator [Zoogloeaceae bacterium]|nr:response regulator [Zoogloeaceae bacterium]